ncbi:hypothetical protein [Sphingopyxis sp.]|uniref:hypothetical protein n=1 Tax=Sphingopyxis sp. TaxID=1908224 RepID=UPI002E048628|nr:hypothetical protein [Sphingopyxis sp.]
MATILRGARVVGDEIGALIPRAVGWASGVVGEQRDMARACHLRLDIDAGAAQPAARERIIGIGLVAEVDFGAQMFPACPVHRHQLGNRNGAARELEIGNLDGSLHDPASWLSRAGQAGSDRICRSVLV